MFLEQTIQSVLDQNYPNLEYIIIDGGSQDNSVEIIKKYQRYLAYWVSEKDGGQTDAIEKGFALATGDYLAWLNSDDTYLPGSLFTVSEAVTKLNNIDVIYGDYIITDSDGKLLLRKREIPFHFDIMLYGVNFIGQPAAFFSRRIWSKVGKLRRDLIYYMDLEFWLRIAQNGGKFKHIRRFLATYRYHNKSKTVTEHSISDQCIQEINQIQNQYWNKKNFDHTYVHKFYYQYLNIYNRVKRQIIKLFYQHTFDLIPGKPFMWYIKRFNKL